jgi:hypothetical protein
MQLVEGTIALTAVLSILAFAVYVAALVQMPTGERPKVPGMDRFGRPLPPAENPGYQETEDETH